MSALLTYEQAAEYTAFSTSTLRRWVAERKIPCIRFSHTAVRLCKEDLDRYIAENRQKAVEG